MDQTWPDPTEVFQTFSNCVEDPSWIMTTQSQDFLIQSLSGWVWNKMNWITASLFLSAESLIWTLRFPNWLVDDHGQPHGSDGVVKLGHPLTCELEQEETWKAVPLIHNWCMKLTHISNSNNEIDWNYWRSGQAITILLILHSYCKTSYTVHATTEEIYMLGIMNDVFSACRKHARHAIERVFLWLQAGAEMDPESK